MIRSFWLCAPVLTAFAVLAADASAEAPRTSALLERYFATHDALARDDLESARARAKQLADVARTERAPLGAAVTAAAQDLSKAATLGSAREAFKRVSAPLADWALREKPAGVRVVDCSMAKARWLQRATDAAIRNPYYGAEMLACGVVLLAPPRRSNVP